jgi:hypothetical protein
MQTPCANGLPGAGKLTGKALEPGGYKFCRRRGNGFKGGGWMVRGHLGEQGESLVCKASA